jgi:hypothetical protein
MRSCRPLLALLAAFCSGALACEAPDDLGGAPWRVLVARIKHLPEVEAWADHMQRERNVVQYVLLMNEPKVLEKRCYWPVEVRADGRLWRRYLVTPDGKTAFEEKAR